MLVLKTNVISNNAVGSNPTCPVQKFYNKNMYLLIVFLPLLGSLSAGFFGKKIGIYGSAHITIFCLVLVSITTEIVPFFLFLKAIQS